MGQVRQRSESEVLRDQAVELIDESERLKRKSAVVLRKIAELNERISRRRTNRNPGK